MVGKILLPEIQNMIAERNFAALRGLFSENRYLLFPAFERRTDRHLICVRANRFR